jgi:DNA repair protein RadB
VEIISKQSSGAEAIDSLLKGGYEKDIITTLYGPSSTGKTCLAILAVAEVLKQGKKVIYVDTEGGFSIDRAMQLYPEFMQKSDNLVFFRPNSFAQQKQVLDKLPGIMNQNIGLVVLDSVAMFYRLEVSISADYTNVNKELNQQMMTLLEIAREHNIPILMTNQVYANMENRNEVSMVGGDLIKYTSKCIVELKKAGNIRKAVIKKHRSLPEGVEIAFRIEEKGLSAEK